MATAVTADDARWVLERGLAQKDDVLGWCIAHQIAGELEWYRVNEYDADLLERLA